jgi:hypothetical protein
VSECEIQILFLVNIAILKKESTDQSTLNKYFFFLLLHFNPILQMSRYHTTLFLILNNFFFLHFLFHLYV